MQSDAHRILSSPEFTALLAENERLAILVGAGVSIDAPSHLVDGGTFSRSVLRNVCPRGVDEAWLLSVLKLPPDLSRPGEYLRFEMMMSALVQSELDRDLKVLGSLNESEEPNLNHYLLAALIGSGVVVMTTNFDGLIETAYQRLNHRQLRVVYGDEDFPTSGPLPETPPSLWKLHGSFEDGASLDATITAILGRNMALGKRKFLEGVLRTHDVVVVGYSGGDDLDLTPVLSETTSARRLIWVQHCRDADDVQMQVDGAALGESSAVMERDLVGRSRILHMATRGKAREFGRTVLLTAPTSEWLNILFGRYCPGVQLPERLPSGGQRDDFFPRWSRNLPGNRSSYYDSIVQVFSNRRARRESAKKVSQIEARLRRSRSRFFSSPEERLKGLIDDYNSSAESSLMRARWLRGLRDRVKRVGPTVRRDLEGTAIRLMACLEWELAGPDIGGAAFRLAVDADREIGNQWGEFQTLHTWGSFAGVNQWSEIFPEFESDALRSQVSDSELDRLRTDARLLAGDLLPEDQSHRKVELAHRTGQLPMLWSNWVGTALSVGVDCEPPMDVIWAERLERLIRFAVDMGDVAGEAQASLARARWCAGTGRDAETLQELLRVIELCKILEDDGGIRGEAAMVLALRAPSPEVVKSAVAELQRSMWGRALAAEP